MPDTIEAEILEIDGAAPLPPRPSDARADRQDSGWRAMQGRVFRLDRRWWPVWVVLGLAGFTLLLAVGILAGVCLIVAKLTGGFLRFLTGDRTARSRSGLSRPLP